MRKIVASEFVSLDGVFEAPDQWHFPYWNDEMGEAIGEGFASSDAMMMGRVNYEEWAAYPCSRTPEASRAGSTEEWSNGPMEVFVHKLKLITRQDYGR